MRPLDGHRAGWRCASSCCSGRDRRAAGGGRPGDLGVWITPTNPTLGQLPRRRVESCSKPVVDLAAPAAYRFRVAFRWIGAHGPGARHGARAAAAICRQPELRPDLAVTSIAVAPIAGRPERRMLYTRGDRQRRADRRAGPFEVLFAPGDGSTSPTTDTGHAAARAHAATPVAFTGPAVHARPTPPHDHRRPGQPGRRLNRGQQLGDRRLPELTRVDGA